MSKGIFKVPTPVNENVLTYAPGTIERKELKKAIEEARSAEADIPMYIGGKEIRTGNKKSLHPLTTINMYWVIFIRVKKAMWKMQFMQL